MTFPRPEKNARPRLVFSAPLTWHEVEDADSRILRLPAWMLPMIEHDNGPGLERDVMDTVVSSIDDFNSHLIYLSFIET